MWSLPETKLDLSHLGDSSLSYYRCTLRQQSSIQGPSYTSSQARDLARVLSSCPADQANLASLYKLHPPLTGAHPPPLGTALVGAAPIPKTDIKRCTCSLPQSGHFRLSGLALARTSLSNVEPQFWQRYSYIGTLSDLTC